MLQQNVTILIKSFVQPERGEGGVAGGEMKVKRGVMWWLVTMYYSGDQSPSLLFSQFSLSSRGPHTTPHHTTPHHTTPHMELTTSTPSHCILQVLLVSPPPPSHHSHHIEPSQNSHQTNNTNSKPFSPWKPGDAYSVEQDLSDWRLLLGSIDEGDQTRWGRG